MSINTKHPDHEAREGQWKRCRDAVSGSDAIKDATVEYLPQLNQQGDAAYSAYRKRALWYGATSRTLGGLSGLVFRKEIDVEGVANEDILKSVTAKGLSLNSFARQSLREVLCAGRYGVHIDLHAGSLGATLSPYRAERIVNWRTRLFEGRQQLTLIVLEETNLVPAKDNIYELKPVTQYRELFLDKADEYVVRVWRKIEDKWQVVDQQAPVIFEKRLPEIPFVFFGPVQGSPDVDKSPLLDIVDVNLSHYRSSADLEHGRHKTALPVYVLAGFDTDTKLVVGSDEAWVSDNASAKAYLLEYLGQGLSALEEALSSKERLMAVLGARLLEEQKKDSEAAETVRLRQAGEQSTLASVAESVSESLSACVNWMIRWSGKDSSATVKLNTDYFPAALTDREIVALMQLWQGGGISWPTLHHNLMKGEITRAGVSEEDERALIDQEIAGEPGRQDA